MLRAHLTKLKSTFNFRQTRTCLFSEKVGVAAVMAHIAVKHIIGHKGKTGPVETGKGKILHHENRQHVTVNTTANIPWPSTIWWYIRSVNAKRVCSEPLHTQGTLQLHLSQLSPTLLISRPCQGISSFRALSNCFLSKIHRNQVSHINKPAVFPLNINHNLKKGNNNHPMITVPVLLCHLMIQYPCWWAAPQMWRPCNFNKFCTVKTQQMFASR